jgi:hypothetical protein
MVRKPASDTGAGPHLCLRATRRARNFHGEVSVMHLRNSGLLAGKRERSLEHGLRPWPFEGSRMSLIVMLDSDRCLRQSGAISVEEGDHRGRLMPPTRPGLRTSTQRRGRGLAGLGGAEIAADRAGEADQLAVGRRRGRQDDARRRAGPDGCGRSSALSESGGTMRVSPSSIARHAAASTGAPPV